jgi:hypothetical protein
LRSFNAGYLLQELLAKMLVAEEEKKERLADMNRRMFARFADRCVHIDWGMLLCLLEHC